MTALMKPPEQRRKGPKPNDLLAHFFNNYIPEPNSGCWLWDGRINQGGYGVATIAGHTFLMHRLSLMLHTPWQWEKRHALHRCDVPSCVNPDHLFWGTQDDNMRDAASKKRLHNRFQSSKTHCPKGHPFSEENTRRAGDRRVCRTCEREHTRLFDQQHPEKYRARLDRRNERRRAAKRNTTP